jgi:threonine dehydrogenase-like Zn-dependent dehydrogenase
VALHESQVFKLPANVSDEQAVLADPFAVSFHAVVKDPPDGEEPIVLVYGAGTIGLAAVAAVKVVKPKARVVVIARYPQQVAAAKRLGATEVLTSRQGAAIIRAIAELTGARPWKSRWHGLPMLSGGVDAVYDSICSPQTIEIGIRVVRPRGIVSIIGVEERSASVDTDLFQGTACWVERLRHRGIRGRPQTRDGALYRLVQRGRGRFSFWSPIATAGELAIDLPHRDDETRMREGRLHVRQRGDGLNACGSDAVAFPFVPSTRPPMTRHGGRFFERWRVLMPVCLSQRCGHLTAVRGHTHPASPRCRSPLFPPQR